jgi:hypothetical protein
MENRHITIEHAFYILALALALGVRFVNISAQPLSEFEAQSAIQAYHLSEGDPAQIGVQPAYSVLTALLFTLFGSNEFLARLLPALIGSLLALLPFAFRTRLGKPVALVLAFGIALDPTLVGLSRLVGSPILGFSLLLFAAAALISNKTTLAGILAGLALLSGPIVLAGIFSLVLAWAISRFFRSMSVQRSRKDPEKSISDHPFRPILITIAVTIILVGTLFLRYPQGLSALGASIPVYIAGWISPSGVPIIHLILALITYQPIALLFGLMAALRNWLQPSGSMTRWLSLWLLAAFLLTFAYPARQVGDLVWVLAPLWALAALEIGRHLRWQYSDGLTTWGQAGLTMVLLTFLAMYTARVTLTPVISNLQSEFQFLGVRLGFNQQLVTTLSILGMGVISTFLIAAGWSRKAAVRGLVWGISAFLGVLMVSASWNTVAAKERIANELWFPGPAAGNVRLMADTLANFSEYFTGSHTGLEVVYQADLAGLQWTFRNLQAARYSDHLAVEESPEAVITYETSQDPRLSAFYRGQSFSWSLSPNWEGALPSNLQRWWFFRDAPTISENLILWLRSDIFPEDHAVTKNFSAVSGQTLP